MLDLPIINHAEDDCLRCDGVMNEGIMSTRLGLPGNPSISESTMVHRDLKLAEMTGAKLHVPHVSTAASVKHIKEMKSINNKITAEVTPHHLFFNDEDLVNYNTNLKVAPPIRSDISRKALIKGILDGTIDCIATDHAPHALRDKETTFDLASFGMIGLESCFGIVKKILVDEEGLSLINLVNLLTVSPRKIAAPAVTANGVPCNIAEAEDSGVSTIALTKNNAPNKSPRVLIITCLSNKSRLNIGCWAALAIIIKNIEPSTPIINIISDAGIV